MPTDPAFDWSQAASLLGDDPQQVDSEMGAIVLELIATSEIRLQELKALDPADPKPISALAHQLRGSLLNFGYTEVGRILQKIESKDYQPAEFVSVAEEAISVFHASNKLMADRYPSLGIA
jgi:HPt (histidine-containing phosphotransfer) domain-containing protein